MEYDVAQYEFENGQDLPDTDTVTIGFLFNETRVLCSNTYSYEQARLQHSNGKQRS